MFISDFAIKRPIITVVAMLALALGGVIALFKLQTDEFPDVAPPIVTVGIPYPGASPETVEKEVLDPVEEAIDRDQRREEGDQPGRGRLRRSCSSSSSSRSRSTRRRRTSATPSPASATTCRRRWRSRSSRSSTTPTCRSCRWRCRVERLSPAELTRLADPGITRELRSIAGVAEVTVAGAQERELTVELRPAALQANGVSVSQVVQALQAQNLAAPVGRADGRSTTSARSGSGAGSRARRTSLQLVVAERGGTLVRLGQVADVRDGTEEQRTLALFNGKPRRRHRRQEVAAATAPPTWRRRCSRSVERIEATTARGRDARHGEELGHPRERRRAQRAGDAGRGRRADGAGGVPVPQLVALDGDHRPGAAGERAGELHRGVGASASSSRRCRCSGCRWRSAS